MMWHHKSRPTSNHRATSKHSPGNYSHVALLQKIQAILFRSEGQGWPTTDNYHHQTDNATDDNGKAISPRTGAAEGMLIFQWNCRPQNQVVHRNNKKVPSLGN